MSQEPSLKFKLGVLGMVTYVMILIMSCTSPVIIWAAERGVLGTLFLTQAISMLIFVVLLLFFKSRVDKDAEA